VFLPRDKDGFHFPREVDNADAERASEIEGGGGRGAEREGDGELERKTGKKEVTPRKSGGARVERTEAEWKRQLAVSVESNWNLLMKFTLVTIKLSGPLA
jgi:hypothetical protein